MCQVCALPAKQEESDAFAGWLVDSLNRGALGLMISVGHRTGLFDAMADLPPSTSSQIAEAAGLNERYVREWLGAMTTGGVVRHDPTRQTYHLPPSHAASLTRKSPTANLAVFAQYLPVLAGVEDAIVDCFRQGGGVPYERYPRFQDVMAEDSGQSIVPVIVEQVVPMVDGLRERLEEGIDVLDIGCGSGLALMRLAEAFPASRFCGLDLSEQVTAKARGEAAARGLANIDFVTGDAASLEPREAYDWVLALDAIHDQAKPEAVLQWIRQSLRPGGVFLMQDIDLSSRVENNLEHPIAPLIYTVSCLHCMTVSLAQGGRGLGAAWGRELASAMLKDAGFRHIAIQRLPHDIQNCYYVVR